MFVLLCFQSFMFIFRISLLLFHAQVLETTQARAIVTPSSADVRFSCPVYFYFVQYTPLSSYCLLMFVLFHFCCSLSRVYGKTLVHESHVSYRHSEWYLLFIARRNSPCIGRSFANHKSVKLN